MATITNERALIYLWTRDAEFPVNQETEDYIVDHLEKLKGAVIAFSDDARSVMAANIMRRLNG